MHGIRIASASEKRLTFPTENETTVGKILDGLETWHLKAKSPSRSNARTTRYWRPSQGDPRRSRLWFTELVYRTRKEEKNILKYKVILQGLVLIPKTNQNFPYDWDDDEAENLICPKPSELVVLIPFSKACVIRDCSHDITTF